VLTIIVAELSYRFYETPFLRLKDRLSRSMSGRKPKVEEELRLAITPAEASGIPVD
jgi:peptidoglycan/LPS O-acetylase OafA/YrhL